MKNLSPLAALATLSLPLVAAAQDSAAADTLTTVADTLATAADSTAAVLAQAGSLEPLTTAYVSLAALAAAVLPVTGWLKTHVLKTVNPQYLSWLVSAALAAVGYALKLGIFAAATPTATALYAVSAGLISNGVANLAVVKVVLALLGARVKKAK